MLAIAMMAAMATSPGQTYGVAVFNPSLRETLQLSESQLSFAYLLGTLLACLPQTIFGSLMDRYGNQRVM
ncbi:MAG: MFS transporter, partial [Pirellulaceae bacterium]|nr:MFS transporter [Pirellulaceae bacterium]